MSAQIEIGRLSVKDLGKTVNVDGTPQRLRNVMHGEFGTEVLLDTHWHQILPSDTLIEITGKETNA